MRNDRKIAGLRKQNGSMKNFCLLGLLMITTCIFGAVPIQEKSLSGAAAAEARLKLLAAAESYLNTPYRYAGLDRRGLDCSGLVYLSFREGLKYTIPRTAEAIYNWAEKIPTAELQIGDLVFFITTGSEISHLGIYAGDSRFIHSASEGPRTGVMYSRLDEAYWKRTYKGAGRALPWDEEAARAMASGSFKSAGPAPVWTDMGFFTGLSAAWTWGGFIEGTFSPFRGISAFAAVGYKWSSLKAGLELRPEFDLFMGVSRLSFTLSMGTDILQFFIGPAFTFGEPILKIRNRERHYEGGGAWLGELGVSAAFPPIKISRGALSFFGELAMQPYHLKGGEKFELKQDFTACFRFSTGLRYLWLLISN